MARTHFQLPRVPVLGFSILGSGLSVWLAGWREGAEGGGLLGYSLCAPPEAPGAAGDGGSIYSLLALLRGSSGLEARGADVRLVEGVGAVHHLGGRGRAGDQHRAQGLMAAQHRREVLHLFCESLDLFPKSRVLLLQVFTLL